VQAYTIQQLSRENLGCLKTLYRDVFHRTVSEEYLLQKYNTGSFGAEYIGFLAITPDGSPAAYYGVIPCFVRINGQHVLAAQSADTMTHPEHQRKGLFLLLAEKTYGLARQKNIQFIFGFPNQNSYNGFVRLGWQFAPEPMKLFRFAGSFFPYAKLLRRSRLLFNAFHNLLHVFLSSENFAAGISPGKEHDGIPHDGMFLNYKGYSKTIFVRINESYLWLKVDGTLKVGLVVLQKDRSADWLIGKLKNLAILLGCQKIIFMTGMHSTLYDLLRPLAEPTDALPVGFYDLGEMKTDLTKLTFEYCDIDIF
jgi:hypothetical protein